jgi:hypothetical protein
MMELNFPRVCVLFVDKVEVEHTDVADAACVMTDNKENEPTVSSQLAELENNGRAWQLHLFESKLMMRLFLLTLPPCSGRGRERKKTEHFSPEPPEVGRKRKQHPKNAESQTESEKKKQKNQAKEQSNQELSREWLQSEQEEEEEKKDGDDACAFSMPAETDESDEEYCGGGSKHKRHRQPAATGSAKVTAQAKSSRKDQSLVGQGAAVTE